MVKVKLGDDILDGENRLLLYVHWRKLEVEKALIDLERKNSRLLTFPAWLCNMESSEIL